MRKAILLFLVGFASAAQFPDKWERCPASAELDFKRNECIERTLANIIQDLSKPEGEPSLGVRTLDPLRVKILRVGKDEPNSPVRLHIDFIKPDIVGLSKLKIKKVTGKFSSPKNWKFQLQAEIKRIQLIGNYKVKGQILILPIVGEGWSNITMDNIKALATIYGQPLIKNDKEYMKVTNQTAAIFISKLHIRLDNLFNGNKALSDNMNKVLNDNWELLYQELKTSLEGEFMRSIVSYMKGITEKVPYNELVITE